MMGIGRGPGGRGRSRLFRPRWVVRTKIPKTVINTTDHSIESMVMASGSRGMRGKVCGTDVIRMLSDVDFIDLAKRGAMTFLRLCMNTQELASHRDKAILMKLQGYCISLTSDPM